MSSPTEPCQYPHSSGDAALQAPAVVAVSLQSRDGRAQYASTTFTNISTTWQQLSATLTTQATGDAQLAIESQGGADVALEFVSLLPAANVQAQGKLQNPFPFRADLLQMLRDLKPRWGQQRRVSELGAGCCQCCG